MITLKFIKYTGLLILLFSCNKVGNFNYNEIKVIQSSELEGNIKGTTSLVEFKVRQEIRISTETRLEDIPRVVLHEFGHTLHNTITITNGSNGFYEIFADGFAAMCKDKLSPEQAVIVGKKYAESINLNYTQQEVDMAYNLLKFYYSEKSKIQEGLELYQKYLKQ